MTTNLEEVDRLFAEIQEEITVDPLLTVGAARWVPPINNMDEGQTAAAGQHWTGTLKYRLSAHY